MDLQALKRMAAFVRQHNIHVLHAHGVSLLVSTLMSLFPPHPRVVWHHHFGLGEVHERPACVYGPAARRAAGVIAVNAVVAQWSVCRLKVPAERVWYIPNFVLVNGAAGQAPELPGCAGSRILCVANLRPQKDHITLVQAMALVTRHAPSAHLLLVGSDPGGDYPNRVRAEIERLGMSGYVSCLGLREDVPAILRGCDVGVLSSVSDGLPLALLEYGAAGLPAVATGVGQCAEVLADGEAGVIVPAGSPEALADGMLSLLSSAERRDRLGQALRDRVEQHYGSESVMRRVCHVYERITRTRGTEGQAP